eukprot:7361687-Pyramimonas_sp.AAC.1
MRAPGLAPLRGGVRPHQGGVAILPFPERCGLQLPLRLRSPPTASPVVVVTTVVARQKALELRLAPAGEGLAFLPNPPGGVPMCGSEGG